MTVTINDVAQAAGVSKGAVSYALNGQPGVSDDTRERILKVARELGWTPNLRAKSLSSAKAFAVGLVVARDPRLLGTDPFFPAFIAGIETTLVEHEYALVLTVAASADAEEMGYRKLAADSRVDGVILTDMRVDDSRIALLKSLKIPAVTLNRPETSSPFPAVCMDDTEGIAAAVEHLVSLGHTRIGHVGGPQSYIHGRSRRHNHEHVVINDSQYEAFRANVLQFLAAPLHQSYILKYRPNAAQFVPTHLHNKILTVAQSQNDHATGKLIIRHVWWHQSR